MKRVVLFALAAGFLALSPAALANYRHKPRLRGVRKQFVVIAHPKVRAKSGTTKSGTKKTGTTKTGTGTKTVPGTGTGSGPTDAPVADPSGTPIPTGNLPGWTEDFADDFTESSFAADPAWTAYSGAPAGSRDEGWWEPSHDVITDGELQLRGYQDPLGYAAGALPGSYVTGGVETSDFSQTYGKYLVRFRIDQGQGIAFDALLWPITDGSHDEIDFAEDNGAAPRQWNTVTVHYGPNNMKLVNALEVNMTQWHTIGVEWSPGQVVYTIDGRDWATSTNPNIPSQPMRLDLQTQAWACGSDPWEQCTDQTTPNEVDMEVDWVVAYSRS